MREQLFAVREACQTLGLPPSTLRAYSARLAPLLSPWAAGSALGERRFRRRMYTQKDLAVLGSAKELLGKGMRFREVLEQLREEQGGRRSREEAAPSRLSYPEGLEAGQLRALVEAAQASIRLTEGALAQWRTIAQEREKELIRLQRILEEREREIASLRNGVEAATAQIQELKAKVEELEGKKRWPFTR